MRRWGIYFCIALISLMLGVSITAADPTIVVSATRRDGSGAVVTLLPVMDKQGTVVPPVALLGEYIIASGQGFPASQPVQAFLVVQGQTYPLSFQDLRTSVTDRQPIPMTDGTGAFQNFAFTLPVVGQVTSGSAEVLIGVGSASGRAPVTVDTGIATRAGRGDKIAVSIGAGFLIVSVVLILLLLRGLPVYPTGQATARRKSVDTA